MAVIQHKKGEVAVNKIMFSAERSWDGNGWGAPWFGITFLLLIVIIGGIAIYLARRRPTPPAGGTKTDAEQELALRFARGDIDEDDYLARLSTLRGSESDA